MKLKAWLPATVVLASIGDRSMRSPWAWLKSVIRSAPAPVRLWIAPKYWKRSAPAPPVSVSAPRP